MTTGLRLDRAQVAVGLIAAVVAVTVAWFARWGVDWPAQEFRAWSAGHSGILGWSDQWYSGVSLAGYSVLYPLFGAFLGAAGTGVAAAVGAWLGAAGLAPVGPARRLGFLVSCAFVVVCDLLIGQVPFLLGAAFGVWAVRAVVAKRLRWAALAAAAASLASPLTGGLLLVAVPAVAAWRGRRSAVPLTAALTGLAAAQVLGGAGGPFPFPWRTGLWVLIFCAALLVLPRSAPARWFGLSYLVVGAACFVVTNPVAGNVARFGQLVALPLVWLLADRLRLRSRAVLAVLATSAALWSAWPAVTGALHVARDPSTARSYYAGLDAFLHREDADERRIEIVFTRAHWETYWVARQFPIARGWERQTDLAVNAVLYHRLTPAGYLQWLRRNAVSFVALPDTTIDFGGRAEAALLRHPPAYLAPAWHDRHWRVWRVLGGQPIVTGPATLTTLGADYLRLSFRAAGSAVVRVRAGPTWSISSGEACLDSSGRWLRVRADARSSITLSSGTSLAELSRSGTQCS